MATNPVTRRLAFSSMSPHLVGTMRPVKPDGQVALHYTTWSFSLSECTRQVIRGMITSRWPHWRRIGA
eukprot:6212093-Pleurochrysis_carterae.AAC.3